MSCFLPRTAPPLASPTQSPRIRDSVLPLLFRWGGRVGTPVGRPCARWYRQRPSLPHTGHENVNLPPTSPSRSSTPTHSTFCVVLTSPDLVEARGVVPRRPTHPPPTPHLLFPLQTEQSLSARRLVHPPQQQVALRQVRVSLSSRARPADGRGWASWEGVSEGGLRAVRGNTCGSHRPSRQVWGRVKVRGAF